MEKGRNIPLIGYTDRLSARPGESLEFKISSSFDQPYCASLVRIICADPNLKGPGIIEQKIDGDFAGEYPSREQGFFPGSYGLVSKPTPLNQLVSFTAYAKIWPTAPLRGKQVIISKLSEDEKCGFVLKINQGGQLTAVVGDGRRLNQLCLGTILKERNWYQVWMSFDANSGELQAGQLILTTGHEGGNFVSRKNNCSFLPARAGCHLGIAAQLGKKVKEYFNGKLEAPGVYNRALSEAEMTQCFDGASLPGQVAHWDFSQKMSTSEIIDISPNELHGELVNMPTRAMTGYNWTGREMCWRHSLDEYGAIHFHDDDIYDFKWETDFRFMIPENLPSGIYAVKLECGVYQDRIPFFILPPRGKRTADLCLLISTFTYTVYGNHARPDFQDSWRNRIRDWEAYPYNPVDYPQYGLSTYNFHSDGSGICFASHRRPLMNLRPGYLTFGEGEGSGLRHLQADSHLIAWLETKGYDYDLITDQELHQEGLDSIRDYPVVCTGSHPEYHTSETLDALQSYRDQGGRLIYLGGNGFYWRVALSPQMPGMIEIRRAESGIRAWAAEPGEYYHVFDGAYGGLWRRNGRPPQKLSGIGFSAQGKFEGSYYRRTRESNDPKVSWLFDGIEDEILGDFGFSGGGAAGFELDRADIRLGTPDNVWIVARSENHQPSFVLVPEEKLTHITNWPGEEEAKLIRADMVYFQTPQGGAVFSTGSITFCGSLPWNNFDNNISRLLSNVLNRFLSTA